MLNLLLTREIRKEWFIFRITESKLLLSVERPKRHEQHVVGYIFCGKRACNILILMHQKNDILSPLLLPRRGLEDMRLALGKSYYA